VSAEAEDPDLTGHLWPSNSEYRTEKKSPYPEIGARVVGVPPIDPLQDASARATNTGASAPKPTERLRRSNTGNRVSLRFSSLSVVAGSFSSSNKVLPPMVDSCSN
jgi:hypothetical protein